MRIVFWVKVPTYAAAIMDEIGGMPGIELVTITEEDELAAALEGAEAVISGGASQYTPEVAAIYKAHGKGLRWFQTVSAGNDGFSQLGPPNETLIITGTGGHSGPVVAEHAVTLLLAVAHAIPRFVRNMEEGVRSWSRDFRPHYRSLSGGTAVVMGLGAIGAGAAKRLRANDMKVIGLNHSGTPHPEVDETHKLDALIDVLADASALVVAAPLTRATTNLVGAEALAALGPQGYLVNVSRGGLVDTAALEAALRNGTIKGAGLDVTEPEPLPPEHSLWSAPNLLISPHCGGGGNLHSPRRLAQRVRANLEAFLAGRELQYRLVIYE